MMPNAYLDTTVVVNISIKEENYDNVLKNYDKIIIPHYAIKELFNGVLKSCIWLYNKVIFSNSLSDVLKAIKSIHRRKYRVSTSLELLSGSLNESFDDWLSKELKSKYSDKPNFNKLPLDKIAIDLKRKIYEAHSINTIANQNIVQNLACFNPSQIYYKLNLMHLDTICNKNNGCFACKYIVDNAPKAKVIRGKLIKEEKYSEELKNKTPLIKKILKGYSIDKENECKRIGDLYFIICCPQDTAILTTNKKDYYDICNDIGQKVEIV